MNDCQKPSQAVNLFNLIFYSSKMSNTTVEKYSHLLQVKDQYSNVLAWWLFLLNQNQTSSNLKTNCSEHRPKKKIKNPLSSQMFGHFLIVHLPKKEQRNRGSCCLSQVHAGPSRAYLLYITWGARRDERALTVSKVFIIQESGWCQCFIIMYFTHWCLSLSLML